MPRMGLRWQIFLFTVFPVLLVTATTGLYVAHNYHVELALSQQRQLERHARVLTRMAAPALLGDRRQELQQLLDSAVDRELHGARLLANDGQVLFSAGATHTPDSKQLRWPIYRYSHTAQPLPDSDSAPILGWIELTASPQAIGQYRYQTVAASLVWVLFALLAAVFLGGRLYRHMSERLQVLKTALAGLDSHDWSARIPASDNSDWQSLTSVINELAHRTQQQLHDLRNQIEHSHQDLQSTLESLELSNIELESARGEALSASQAKSAFLANTSHEVRTPLTGILGFCRVLQQSESNPRKLEYLNTIEHSAQHLLGILNDILDLSKIEAGKFSLDNKTFELRPLIEESVSLFAHQAAEKSIELIIDADENLPRWVIGDPLRLKQIVTNLVSNAVKFTDSGQVLVTLDAPLKSHTVTNLIVRISDTGVGIEHEQQGQLFEAFSRLDGAESRAGTGLGLAIVKKLADAMGATLTLKSCPGRGSTFQLSLELARAACDEPLAHNRCGSVLLWDRNTDSQRALTRLLQPRGFQVRCFTELESLLNQANSESRLLLSLRDNAEYPMVRRLLGPRQKATFLVPTLDGELFGSDADVLQKPPRESRLLQALQHEAPQPSNKMPPTPRARRVLAVDDNANSRLLLKLLLEAAGATPELSSDGRDALSKCAHTHYPLIILDLQMPNLGGSEVAAELRRNPLNHDSYLVALTAHSNRDSVEPEALRHFDRFLSKPVSPEQLRELLLVSGESASRATSPVSLRECLTKSNGLPELARRLLEKFLDSLDDSLREWRAANEQRDLPIITSLAHQLEGACAYVGTPRLQTTVRQLQAALRRDTGWCGFVEQEVAAVIVEMGLLRGWRDHHDIETLFSGDDNPAMVESGQLPTD